MNGVMDSDEFFDLLSNSTRIDILRTLANAHEETPDDPWLEYTELRTAVGVRDNGNFNYHLDRMGDLVVKGPTGYCLSRIGMAILSTVASGVFDPDWRWGPVDTPGDCQYCDDRVQLVYRDGNLWLTCGADDHTIPLSVPPSVLDSHPDDAVVEQVAMLQHQWIALTRQGICAECYGHVDGSISYGGAREDHYHYHGECRRCGFHHGVPVGLLVLGHPTVQSFYYERGIDIRTVPFWTLDFCEPGSETMLSSDPLRLQIDVAHDGDELHVTLDRDGTIVSTDHP
ncbi:winged helix-turn-helix domain-containing protein [Haladaptatus caseinilyticus]|uniref:winged helix-turn-helix domain-containing protein n=1 Tax=Haladaptatus caseinilyticus TaxID=2993314 RepID=UPI00224B194C|nr:helix-turn-helix domain-containing protein [Haladaptatus caseinilyticus]